MKRVVCVAVALVAAVAAARADGPLPPMPSSFRAAPERVLARAASIGADSHPDADYVLLDERVHTRYESDGTDVTWNDEWFLVLTDRGVRRLSTFEMSVQRRYGDAEIQCVEVYGTNGVPRAVDISRTLKEATDNGSMDMNIVDPMDRVLSCAVPDLARGEIRHVRTCRRLLKPRVRGAWCDVVQLEHMFPVVSAQVSVDAPSSLPLASVRVRNPAGGTLREHPAGDLPDSRRLYRWSADGVPQYFPEPRMPVPYTCVQALHLSTFSRWQEVSVWYWNLCRPRLEATHEAMTNKVAALLAGIDPADAERRQRALFRFVSQDVRYMGLTLEDESPGYAPHDASVTFDNLYGVCRDKAALLVAMMRIAGFEAYPVLIHAGARLDPDVPTPYFNHAIVAVAKRRPPERGGLLEDSFDDYVFMDPTNEATPDLFPTYLSGCSCLVARPEGGRLLLSPVPPVADNLFDVATDVDLLADGSGVVRTRAVFNGLNDNAFRAWLLERSPDARRRGFERIVGRIQPGAELVSFDVSPADLRETDSALEVAFSYRAPSLVRPGESRDAFRPPYVTRAINFASHFLSSSFALESRRFPIRFSTTVGSRERVTVRGEAARGAVELPADVVLGDPAAGYAFTRRAEKNADGTFSLVREELLTALLFPTNEYVSIRRLRERAQVEARTEVRFPAHARRTADSRVLSRRVDVHFLSPYAYVQTNATVRRLETYAGKKAFAECRFSDTPPVSESTLVSALVSNANGTVKTLAAHEFNTMDADWVAAAPRYPNTRLHVANLPSVEIGSTVSTVVETRKENLPMPYRKTFLLSSGEPAECVDYRFFVPPGMTFEPIVRRAEGFDVNVSFVSNACGSTEWRYACRRLRETPHESALPPGTLWEPSLTVSTGPSDACADTLAALLAGRRASGGDAARALARRLVEGCGTPEERISAIRRHLARNVRRVPVGPLGDMAPADMLFEPDRVLADGYASALDEANLLRTMLEAAGFSVETLLARGDSAFVHEQAAFDGVSGRFDPTCGEPVLVATWKAGGSVFWPFGRGADRRFVLHSGDNEYTPPDTWQGGGLPAWSFDRSGPCVVPSPEAHARLRTASSRLVSIGADGSAVIASREETYGSAVGAMRKLYAEMRPEIRRRHQLERAAGIARNAIVARPLETDLASYPFVAAFSVASAGFASIQDGVMTVSLPGVSFGGVLPALGSDFRRGPVAVGRTPPGVETDEIVFPAGWTLLERAPEPFVLTPPGEERPWAEQTVDAFTDGDGRLHVRLTRSWEVPRSRLFESAFAGYLRTWAARLSSASIGVVSVRWTGDGAPGSAGGSEKEKQR